MVVSVATHGGAWLAWEAWQRTPSENADAASRVDPTGVTLRLLSASPIIQAGPSPQAVINSNRAPELDSPPLITNTIGSPSRFIPADRLDGPVVPKSSPDISRLRGLYFSGLPIQLRILIDETGQVQDVVAMQSTTSDMPSVEHIKAMFINTAYIPGLLHGKAVPTQVDLELYVSDFE
jgi:hypothetical protein